MRRITAGGSVASALRYGISITLLVRLLPRDRVVHGRVGSYRSLFDMRDDIQRQVYLGAYDPVETRLMRDLLAPGDVFFDIGANIGYYSIIASQLVGESGAVHAFEPLPENCAFLSEVIATNSVRNIVANETAVGAVDGHAVLYPGSLDVLSGSGWASFQPSKLRAEGHEYPLVSIDRYVQDASIDRVRLVKIDVEGMEMDVLQGMDALLSRADAPDLICEVCPRLSSAISGYLSERGFRLYSLPLMEEVESGATIAATINVFCSKRPRGTGRAPGPSGGTAR
ncbi:MAG: FkbM family methyltransferase [Chloroflexota bacterium]